VLARARAIVLRRMTAATGAREQASRGDVQVVNGHLKCGASAAANDIIYSIEGIRMKSMADYMCKLTLVLNRIRASRLP